MEPIITRVGQILDGDNRFLGRSVFDDWVHQVEAPSDALLLALGVKQLTALNRETIRLISLCLTSPDARVWPLKLTRLLASWGDPLVGHFGGQLAAGGRVMGPGAGTHAARCLEWVSSRVGDTPTVEAVGEALTEWKQQYPGPIGGFGVPFRPVDERRAALLRFVGDGPLAHRRYWMLHLQFVECLAPTPPNCAVSFAAMLLDTGIAVDHCGLAFNVLMPHVFLAHALEASQTDGEQLNALPPHLVQYNGTGPRVIGDGQRATVRKPLQRVPLE